MPYTDFPYKTQPYKHQHDCWTLSRDTEAYAYFMEMGCIDGDAEITIWPSVKLTLKELHEKCESGEITSAQTKSFEGGKLVVNEVLGVFYSGVKETLTVTTALGLSLTLTPDHEVLTPGKGWVSASSLHVGDQVLVSKKSVPTVDQVILVMGSGLRETYDVSMRSPMNNFVVNGMIVHNCGKSKVLIDTAAHQYLNGKINAAVVVAPKPVYLNWHDNEIPTHMSGAVKYDAAYWSASPRAEEKENLRRLMEADGDHLRILCINCEGFTRLEADSSKYLIKFLKKFRSNLVAVDESTSIKNHQAQRTKVLTKIAQNLSKYRRILSGNPIPNGPLDIYSQSEFLKRGLMGFSNYYGFRNRFAVMQDMRYGAKSFLKVVGYRDHETLKQMMRQWAFIIKKADCLDLPSKIYQTVDVEMTKQQQTLYDSMLQDSIIILDSGATVTAQMVMTQLTRLHQISCGILATDQGELDLDPNPRLDVLMELLEQVEGKAIIWATYRRNIVQIKKAITEKFGAETLVDFWGDTTKDERREATRSFQDVGSKVKFMLSNPATGKFGNTWTRGATVIYYSNDYNLEHREQSEDRAHRIGQERDVTYIDLRVRNTVDDRILRTLKAKKKLTDEIVSSNWRWLLAQDQAK